MRSYPKVSDVSRSDTVVICCRWCLYGDGLPIFSCLCFHSCLGSLFTKFYQNQRIRSHACFHWRELSSGAILYEIFSFLLRFVVQDSVTPCLPYVLYKSYGFGSYYFKFTNGGIVWRVPEHICVFKLRAHQRCCLQWWRRSLIDHNDSALCFVEGHFVLGWPANKRINVLLESDNGWAQWNPPSLHMCQVWMLYTYSVSSRTKVFKVLKVSSLNPPVWTPPLQLVWNQWGVRGSVHW